MHPQGFVSQSVTLPRRRNASLRRACPVRMARDSDTPSERVKGGLRLLEAPLSIFGVLVHTARVAWNGGWRLMMAELAPSSSKGDYVRPASSVISSESTELSDAVLFVGYACPWCHRVLLARALLGLEDNIQVVQVLPGKDGLWMLPDGPDKDRWGSRLRDVYRSLSESYSGRFTAPLLINNDSNGPALVSNESSDILDLLPRVFSIADKPLSISNGDGAEVWLRPPSHNAYGVDVGKLDELCERIYSAVNNGVYKCGFATSQEAYERAERDLFATLDYLEIILRSSRFLCSALLVTEADARLFPTAFRFDAVYSHLFKANRKCLRADYPAISGWLSDIYNFRGVSQTCDLEATRQSYYKNLFPLNPGGIIPVGPVVEYTRPSERIGLGLSRTAPDRST